MNIIQLRNKLNKQTQSVGSTSSCGSSHASRRPPNIYDAYDGVEDDFNDDQISFLGLSGPVQVNGNVPLEPEADDSDDASDDDASEDDASSDEEADDLWKALMLCSEAHDSFTSILKLDARKDFLLPNHHKDISDLVADLGDFLDQFEFPESN
jgi:hypothetical protein